MSTKPLAVMAAVSTAVLAFTASASANSPTGVWIDHTGRGGVEITQCGANLCGRLVWLKDTRNTSACGTQILGNVRPVGAGVWDKGWIFDPEQRARYDVELKPLGADRLRVLGYMGSKLLSETMIWTRAPHDLQRCDGVEAARPAKPPVAAAEPPLSGGSTTAASPPPVADATDESQPAPVARAELPPAAAGEPEPRPRRAPKQRTSKRECRLDLPYVTVTYPCSD